MYCCYADFLYAVFLSHIDYINHTKVVCGALQSFALPYWSSDQFGKLIIKVLKFTGIILRMMQ